MTTTEYEGRTVTAWLRLALIIVVQRSKKQRGARTEEREKGNGLHEGGKRWNLLELSCACGREGSVVTDRGQFSRRVKDSLTGSASISNQ
jgi:hypothetical protein